MIPMRHSPARKANRDLKELAARRGENNVQWLARAQATSGVILFGGSDLAHFRIRVAQSHLRDDLLPSFWSLAGILLDKKRFVSVPLATPPDISDVPSNNGVQICSLADYDDPRRYPNIAVLQFPSEQNPLRLRSEDEQLERDTVELIRQQRSIVNLPALIVPWLGYVWGVGGYGNPLLEAEGLPSAVFVETVYGLAGVELTPGLASASSCPEAIWQSAKWWHRFYQQADAPTSEATAKPPSGAYATRQPAAAIVEPDSEKARAS